MGTENRFRRVRGQMVDTWWTRIEKHAGWQAVLSNGAEGGIRTPTMLPPPAPQAELKGTDKLMFKTGPLLVLSSY